MKKIIALILSMLMAVSFASCGKTSDSKKIESDGKISIVATVFPVYDWIRNIVTDMDNVEVTMLLDTGVDLHSFQPTADDLVKISSCDMFVYVGGESDDWVEDAIESGTLKNDKTINLMSVLDSQLKAEEIVEGMQIDEDEEDDEDEIEYDEHIWLSLKNASICVDALTNKLSSIDVNNKRQYQAHADLYKLDLSALDQKYAECVENAKIKTVLFCDRFPFRYMVDDYGLDYYAAFVGCSAESEASFETIRFLAKKVDEIGLKTVLTLEGTDHGIAETVVKNTKDKNQEILSMNSLQSVTREDVKAGADYIKIMESNLEVLKNAIN